MNFSTNQVRHLFVANVAPTTGDTAPTAVGGLNLKTIGDKGFLFQHMGHGGLVASDMIKLDKVMHVNVAAFDTLGEPLKKATITLDADVAEGAPVAGQEYMIKVTFNNYIGMGDLDTITRVGFAKATSAVDSAEALYKALGESLAENLNNVDEKLVEVAYDANGIVVSALDQSADWRLGVTPYTKVDFSVRFAPITVDGEETNEWAKVKYGFVTDADGATVKCGAIQKLADLEYFCMKERGDVYGPIGWPNVIPVKYLVDMTKEYDVITIHFYDNVPNHGVQKSERDIQILVPAEDITIQTVLEGFGVTVDTLKV